jgi:hypothetical protein
MHQIRNAPGFEERSSRVEMVTVEPVGMRVSLVEASGTGVWLAVEKG